MKDKIIVDIENIQRLLKELRQFNQIPFDSIEFYENGKPLKISDEVKEEFKLTGLMNASFISMRFWEDATNAESEFARYARNDIDNETKREIFEG